MSQRFQPQNVYDDADFFAAYSKLARFGKEFGAAFEHGAFISLLPDVSDLRVLDLGCGAGQLSHFLAERGAAAVTGVDVSERMLELARRDWSHPRVTFVQGSIEEAEFPPRSFDLVVSSLASHYVDDYRGLVQRIAGWLAPHRVLVFSTEHPVYLSRAKGDGWVRGPGGEATAWALDRYGDEGLRVESWLTGGVRKYHRTIETLVNGLLDAGLSVERLLEPMPSAEAMARHPEWAGENRRPMFLLLRARKT